MLRTATYATAILTLTLGAAAGVLGADQSLRGTLLVADAKLTGSIFKRSVILLIDHTNEGAQGLIVNRPTQTTLAEALPGLTTNREHDYPVHLGGPVQPQRLAVLARPTSKRPDLDEVLPGVVFAASQEAVQSLFDGQPPPDRLRFFAGFAGWAPGQLEHEIERGDWHIVPADPEAIFTDSPESLWERLYKTIRDPGKIQPKQSI